MKNYDPNIRWGTHTIEVTLQQWDYVGTLQYEIGGNTKGESVLESVADTLSWQEELKDNLCKFRCENDWFTAELKNPAGEVLEVEEEIEWLGSMIVGVRIISFEEEPH